jgi:hypothetical protein
MEEGLFIAVASIVARETPFLVWKACTSPESRFPIALREAFPAREAVQVGKAFPASAKTLVLLQLNCETMNDLQNSLWIATKRQGTTSVVPLVQQKDVGLYRLRKKVF